jgi:coiled-coil domain-containing protein 55
MSNLMKGKAYGLSFNKKATILPHEHGNPNPMAKSNMVKPSIFGKEDSSDEEEVGDWKKKAMMSKKDTKLKKQTKNEMAAALEEDPTVFQYDEVYDDLEQKKVVEKESKKDVERKPKYIQALLKASKDREQEFERR